MQEFNFIIQEEDQGVRLDVFVACKLQEISRTQAQDLIKKKAVLVNKEGSKANYKLKARDLVSCIIPAPEALSVEPEPIPLEIVYEDRDMLVVNKPQGMVVHPANGNYRGTLVNALLFHCRDLSGINGLLRPGIVHRIDKDTSGLLAVAKTDLAHRSLARMIKEHSVKREYLALVHGAVGEPGGIIDAPIGRDRADRQKMAVVLQNSKNAVTEYRVLERLGEYTLLECRLKTGRTHQIRVHMAFIHHPVVGDPKYGPKSNQLGVCGQALHARTLGFTHPRTGEWLEFTSPLPATFRGALRRLGSQGEFV